MELDQREAKKPDFKGKLDVAAWLNKDKNGVSSALGGLTDSLKNVNNIGGIGPR